MKRAQDIGFKSLDAGTDNALLIAPTNELLAQHARDAEEFCAKTGLPYRVVGGVRFYERREVRDLLAYLRVLVNPEDTVSLRRILNVPNRKSVV